MIKRVLVYLYGKQEHRAAILAAARFSKEHDAHLAGCYMNTEPSRFRNALGIDASERKSEQVRGIARQLEALFASTCESLGVKHDWYKCSADETMPQPVAYSDFIFASQPDMASEYASQELAIIDELIDQSGLAIVLVPKSWDANRLAQCRYLGGKKVHKPSALYAMPCH